MKCYRNNNDHLKKCQNESWFNTEREKCKLRDFKIRNNKIDYLELKNIIKEWIFTEFKNKLKIYRRVSTYLIKLCLHQY